MREEATEPAMSMSCAIVRSVAKVESALSAGEATSSTKIGPLVGFSRCVLEGFWVVLRAPELCVIMNSPSAIETAATWRDYFEMCKPRVVLLMLLCAVVGMFLAAEGMVPWQVLLYGTTGIALVAGSSAALNHLIDAQIDARMARTRDRPMAQGRVSMTQGATFVAVTGISGLSILAWLVNPLTAWLNLASWAGYGLLYTLYLKRATAQNIVIGGIFGAAPPLFGWTAVTGEIELGGVILVLIIFAWTPPHFWALAIERVEEYRDIDMPMLPVTRGIDHTKLQIFIYTLITIALTLVPFFIGMNGLLYLVAALGLGAGFLYWCAQLFAGKNERAPMDTFRYSIFYLSVLFGVMLIDRFLFSAGTELAAALL